MWGDNVSVSTAFSRMRAFSSVTPALSLHNGEVGAPAAAAAIVVDESAAEGKHAAAPCICRLCASSCSLVISSDPSCPTCIGLPLREDLRVLCTLATELAALDFVFFLLKRGAFVNAEHKQDRNNAESSEHRSLSAAQALCAHE